MAVPRDADRALAGFDRAMRAGLRAGECGFFFDFDGTLAPIQLDPRTVRPVPGVVARLTELAQVAGRVALVSARPVSFLASHFEKIDNLRYFGLYGVETATGTSDVRSHPVADTYADLISAVARQAEADMPAGVTVERKRVAVALHYRAAPHLQDRAAWWARATANQHGLTVQKGRMVYELEPPDAPTKGSVVADNAAELRFVWCFGDDIPDVAAFRSLIERREHTPDFAAVLVAVHNPESGDELESLADVVLPEPSAVPVLLDRILGVLRG